MMRSLIAVLILLLLPVSAAGQAAEAVTVYRGAALIDGTGAAARRGVSILVRGERIVKIAAADEAVPEGAAIVDASGLYVLPGLIDSHVHLATPPNRRFAEAEMRRWIHGGVTAVRSMADDTRSIAELARAARVGEIPGPDIGFAALMAGPSFFEDPRTIAVAAGGVPGKMPWLQAITPETDLRLAVAMAKGTGARGIKIYANLPGDLVKAITEEAHRQGMRVWAHGMVFPATPEEVIGAGVDAISHTCYLAYQFSAVRPGSYAEQRPVELEPFAGGGEHPGMARLFAAMKARGILLDPTLRVFAEEAKRVAAGKAKVRRCPLDLAARLTVQAWRAGVEISAGTDGFAPVEEAYTSLHDELELLAKAGMPPLAVLRAATLGGAIALGADREMGTVEAGKLANLVFVRKDPAANVANLRNVAFVVKRGKRFERSTYVPPDAAEIWGTK